MEETYKVIGAIQFWGGDINTLKGGTDQPRTAMYMLGLPEGATITGCLDIITGLLYQHTQEQAQESGQAVSVGLIKAEWPGEITGLFEEMLWYCAGPSVLAAEYADVYGLMQQWAAVPDGDYHDVLFAQAADPVSISPNQEVTIPLNASAVANLNNGTCKGFGFKDTGGYARYDVYGELTVTYGY